MVVTDEQYQRLLQFRTALRHFDQWSREAAESHGLTHGQHQLMLAIRGSSAKGGPTVGEIADALLVKPHTATELIDRATELDLVERVRDLADGRRVRLQLSAHGTDVLTSLTDVHVEELRRLAPLLAPLDPA